jgi:hypothetical protein
MKIYLSLGYYLNRELILTSFGGENTHYPIHAINQENHGPGMRKKSLSCAEKSYVIFVRNANHYCHSRDIIIDLHIKFNCDSQAVAGSHHYPVLEIQAYISKQQEL